MRVTVTESERVRVTVTESESESEREIPRHRGSQRVREKERQRLGGWSTSDGASRATKVCNASGGVGTARFVYTSPRGV